MDKQLDDGPGYAFAALAQREERNSQIEQPLRRAMQSFAARWLPAVMQGTLGGPIRL